MNTQLDKKPAQPHVNKQLAFLKRLWHVLRHNLGWKIAAVLLAIVLWAGLISQDATLVREKTFTDVQVSVTGTETLQRNGFIVVNDLTAEPVAVRMKADVPQLEYNNVTAATYNPRIDLSRIRAAGTQTVKITTSNTSSYGSVIEISPDTVEVEVEEYVTRYRIPVSIVQQGEAPEGFYLANVNLDPALVAVSGPRSLVAQVRKAVAVFDISQLSPKEGSSALAIPFQLMDGSDNVIASSLLQVNSESTSVLLDSVVVEYTLYPTQMITLSGIGMTQGEPAAGYEVKKVTVTPGTIQAAAASETLELLNLEALFLDQAVSLEGRMESFTEVIKVRKPSELVALIPDSVTLAVEIGPVIAEKRFENQKISLLNVSQGLAAQGDAVKGSVTLNAPQLWLERLKSSAVALTCDLSGLEEGTHQVPVQCVIGDSEGISYTYKVEPEMVTVTLSGK